MNKIINQYMIFDYSKIVLNTILIFITLGIVLNLFEEIEFFKNLNQSFTIPLVLSLSFVPTLIFELLPFIIFLASMFYFLHLKSNKDLLSIKIFGYSNLKIILILALFSFLFGCLILITVNPVTSTLVKYYETEKARYANDVDHLISVNKNGFYTIAISRAEDRPRNATKECGMAWLPMADDGDGMFDEDITIIQFRHMLPSDDFKHAIQKVMMQDQLETVMGPYMPKAKYLMPNQVETFFPCPN